METGANVPSYSVGGAACMTVYPETKDDELTQKLSPCRLVANLIALFYNWWNLYVRFHDEERHREAITSRPALMLKGFRRCRVEASKP